MQLRMFAPNFISPINFGAEYEFKKISIGFSGERFSKKKPYEMIKKDGASEDQNIPRASNSSRNA